MFLSTKAEQQDYYLQTNFFGTGIITIKECSAFTEIIKGVIWMGTKWGLNSYDQSELKVIFMTGSSQLICRQFHSFYYRGDRLGDLYVSTNKGIAIYNKAENQFQPLKYNGRAI